MWVTNHPLPSIRLDSVNINPVKYALCYAYAVKTFAIHITSYQASSAHAT